MDGARTRGLIRIGQKRQRSSSEPDATRCGGICRALRAPATTGLILEWVRVAVCVAASAAALYFGAPGPRLTGAVAP